MPEDKVIIFDTTLRDGEQAAGAAMTLDEKLEIARQLERLRVDVIEAGFAASSPGGLPGRSDHSKGSADANHLLSVQMRPQRMWIAPLRPSKGPRNLASTFSYPARTST